jgi:hypothetical protein
LRSASGKDYFFTGVISSVKILSLAPEEGR